MGTMIVGTEPMKTNVKITSRCYSPIKNRHIMSTELLYQYFARYFPFYIQTVNTQVPRNYKKIKNKRINKSITVIRSDKEVFFQASGPQGHFSEKKQVCSRVGCILNFRSVQFLIWQGKRHIYINVNTGTYKKPLMPVTGID